MIYTSMSNGLGASFGGLMLLAVLSVMAGLLGLFGAGVIVSRSRSKRVASRLRYPSVALVLGVVLVAGFAVVALFDEAALLAAVFVAIVIVPLGAVGFYLNRLTESPTVDIIATAGVAWSIPFLIGLVVTFGTPNVINSVFDLSPGESQQLGVYWGATALGAIVVMSGTLWLVKHVSTPFYTVTTPDT